METTIHTTPSVDDLVHIYRNVMQVRLLAEGLLVRGIELKRLALNTEVISSRSKTGGRTFSVMAREVNMLADKITVIITSLINVGNDLARNAVAAAATARLVEKYQEALQRGVGESSKQRVTKVLQKETARLNALLRKLHDLLLASRYDARDLSRLTVHVPVVGTLFRIEASQDDSEIGAVLFGIGAQLDRFRDSLDVSLESLFGQINETLALLDDPKMREVA